MGKEVGREKDVLGERGGKRVGEEIEGRTSKIFNGQINFTQGWK